jgi:uncharacterized membrane protein YedE/YeeE
MEIFENLNWLFYGILIGLFVPITLLLGNKQFGISSAMQNICSVIIPKTKSFFSTDELNKNSWKLYFVIGIVFGGFLAANIFSESNINFLPEKYYSIKGIIILYVGGLLVGFGTRYANGCTSGHSITGLSMFKLSSLIATISFFIGGLFYTFVI